MEKTKAKVNDISSVTLDYLKYVIGSLKSCFFFVFD